MRDYQSVLLGVSQRAFSGGINIGEDTQGKAHPEYGQHCPIGWSLNGVRVQERRESKPASASSVLPKREHLLLWPSSIGSRLWVLLSFGTVSRKVFVCVGRKG